jgi:hypothetical protein
MEFLDGSSSDGLSEPSSHFSSVPAPARSSSDSSQEKLHLPRKTKRRAEIRASHSVHDRLQVESNYTFDLRPRSATEQQRDFRIDLYLFMPNSMGVNSSNFDTIEFFRHRTSYYRVRAPQYQNFRKLKPEALKFNSAELYFSGKLSSTERHRIGRKLVQDVRLFGNFLHTELKKIRSSMVGKRIPPSRRRKAELAAALRHRVALVWSLRTRYLEPIRAGRYLIDDEVMRAFTLTDEYLSYRLELVLLKANDCLPTEREEWSGLLSREIEHRKKYGLLILGQEKETSVAFEAYTYRLGLLKKYLGEALFLQLNSINKDRLYRNYAAAIGAGLAATVAGLAEHQRVQYLTGNDSGMRLAFLIAVAVVAYIFKDRVKDLSKEYFNSRLKERLPDQSFEMFHESYTSKGRKKLRQLGFVSEFFRFLKVLPADVAYLRTLGQAKASDPERREHVMHMGRRYRFELRSKKHRKLFPLLKNVHRLDISPFLSKLDNPNMPISFVGKEGSTTTVQAPKVYHINAVLRHEVRFGTTDDRRFVDYERFRLIVNKNGIVRLEQLIEPGRLAYEEGLT